MGKRDFAAADCETDPFKFGRVPKPFLWGFYEPKGGFVSFDKTEDFVDFIKTKKIVLYFHNGGKFDVHFLLPFISAQKNVMIVDGRICKIKIGECEIRDSWMNFPDKLSAYQKDDIDYNKMERQNRARHMPEIKDYLRGDCVYLYELLERNFELYGQKISLASTAFDYWHKEFYRDVKPVTSKAFFDEFKKYYYGGRCEFFKTGVVKEEFKLYDLNSAYADAMRKNHAYGTQFEESQRVLDKKLENSFIHFRGRANGSLPFRDQGLSFPHDAHYRDYRVTGRELKAALENNAVEIEKVYSFRYFLKTINFSDYIEHFYELKKNSKAVSLTDYVLAKKYLVTLYGKYGMNPEKHREFLLVEQKYILSREECGYEFEGVLGNFALMSKDTDAAKKRYYNVATAASITGYVRALLYKNLVTAKGLLYCDTDSIACKSFAGKIGKELGEWSQEGVFSEGAIAGKKLYAFKFKNSGEYKMSTKGVRLTAQEVYSVARGKSVKFRNPAPSFHAGGGVDFIRRKINMRGNKSSLKKG